MTRVRGGGCGRGSGGGALQHKGGVVLCAQARRVSADEGSGERNGVEAGQCLERWEERKSRASAGVDLCNATLWSCPREEETSEDLWTWGSSSRMREREQWKAEREKLGFWLGSLDSAFKRWHLSRALNEESGVFQEKLGQSWSSRCELGCLFSIEGVGNGMSDESRKPSCWGAGQGFPMPLLKIWWLTLQNWGGSQGRCDN